VRNPSEEDYRRLLSFRSGLRRFLKWSEEQAKAAGLTPKQHQLLLAVRGHDDPRGPTIKEAAGYLLLRHNSTVELVNRAEAGGFIRREQSDGDRRMVRLKLTPVGEQRLRAISELTLEELKRYEPALAPVLYRLEGVRGS
jgi:DNA-binding MarR family transcriptional regulator